MCDEENRREDADALAAAGIAVHAARPGRSPTSARRSSRSPAPSARPRRERRRRSPDLVPLGLRAFVPIWRRPWMTMGAETYGSSVLARSASSNVCADAAERYPEVDPRRGARRAGPMSCWRPRALSVPATGTSPSSTEVAPAVLVDGQDLFWWGVRTPAAARPPPPRSISLRS